VKFTAQKRYVFYPDFNGNLELPEAERLSVEIIRPTAEDHDTLMFIELQQRKDTGMMTTSSNARFNSSKILRSHIGKIKNLTVVDAETGKETAIASGEELAESSFTGMFPLVSKICIEVCMDKIPEGQKKISEQDSASSGTDGTSGN
jgi:hypothetical protein